MGPPDSPRMREENHGALSKVSETECYERGFHQENYRLWPGKDMNRIVLVNGLKLSEFKNVMICDYLFVEKGWWMFILSILNVLLGLWIWFGFVQHCNYPNQRKNIRNGSCIRKNVFEVKWVFRQFFTHKLTLHNI